MSNRTEGRWKKSTEYGIKWKEVGLKRRIEEEGKWPKEQ